MRTINKFDSAGCWNVDILMIFLFFFIWLHWNEQLLLLGSLIFAAVVVGER